MPQYQGVWTLEAQAQAQSRQQWVTDPNFKNTTLLLQADSGNPASQNNAFTDSSTNNFLITRTGNTTQGSFSPFSQAPGYWSNYFDASRIVFPYSSNNDISSGNFTVEFWVNAPAQSVNGVRGVTFFNGSPATGSNIGWEFVFLTTGVVNFTFYNGASGVIGLNTSVILNNTWNHIAVVRNGSAFTLYANGVSQATGSSALTGNTNAAWGTYVGSVTATNTGNSNNLYISNLRIVKGGALYTSNFTPSTTPLTTTVSTGTVSLLTCQSNRFVDNGTYNLAASVNSGTPSVQAFGPFAPALQWTPDVVGGSGYFATISSDYLRAPDNAAWDIGSNSCSMECWAYGLNTTANQSLLSQWVSANDANSSWQLMFSSGGGLYPQGALNNGSVVSITSSVAITLNSWNHIAMARSGTTFSLFLNGTRVATGTVSGSVISSSNAVGIGIRGGSNDYGFSGYIAGSRILNGSSAYDATQSTITVPTAPPTAITNTRLLLNYTNAGIYDGKMANNLETVGNAQVAISPVKYGSGSMYFDGTGDYLVGRTNPALSMGTGAFTWEAWVYPTATKSTAAHIYDTLPPGGTGSRVNSMIWGINSSNKLFVFTNGASAVTSSASIPLNTWTHVAFVRDGTGTNQTKFYINGTNDGTGTVSTNDNLGGQVVGASADNLTNNNAMFQGYIDDLRITKGVARYFTTFTPPQQALPRQ